MFKKNNKHFQIPLTSHVDELPEKLRKGIEDSWSGVFYRDFFCRINEGLFAVLYADCPSRPNIPVNVLVGLEFLKAGNGWTDEQLYEQFGYNVQVRYALGYRQLGEGYFELRTLYNFRERLSRYMQETGINLLDRAFAQVTDEQIDAYQVKTARQRMDSTQVASNIRQTGRIQLLVTVLQRVHRMLTEKDQAHYAETFEPYLKGHAGQYVYRMKREETNEHLQKIGELIHCLLVELKPAYGEEAVYQVLERVFHEHFQIEVDAVHSKPSDQLSASSLQSPDDLEATYRNKRGQGYRGYTANITETCDPENDLQLVTKVQVEPNNVDDTKLLAEALPELTERTDLDTLYTDGSYSSPEMDKTLAEEQVELIQTAIRGRKPSSEKLHLSDFEIKQTEEGKPTQITCPQGQHVKVHPSNRRKSFVAHFELDVCQTCPFAAACPAKPGKRDPRRHLRLTQAQAYVAQRRKRNKIHLEESRNLRAAVEATVRQVKHPFPAGKLPVRGQFRVTCMMIGSGIMSNIRRIQRYRALKMQKTNRMNTKIDLESSQPSPFHLFLNGSIHSAMNYFVGRLSVFCC
ncbi:MAG: transposase [Desulfopila sp.]|jgi:hypothetical protein|nr:transposase [Desulfopila sp.]